MDRQDPPQHHRREYSLSPAPPDIYSISGDLAELIYDLKNANRIASINVKLVQRAGVGTIATGVAKGGAQVILVSGYDGGTGAAPTPPSSTPVCLGAGHRRDPQTLILNSLRTDIAMRLTQAAVRRDVAISCMLGAENSASALPC